MHQVMIHPATYDTVKDAVDKAFELFPMDFAGKKIVIKPNVLRASSPGDHIVTHPAVLQAVVEKVEHLNPAEIIVGDNPGLFSYGDNENSFKTTGLMDAAGGYYRNLGNAPRNVPFHPEYMPEVGVSAEILDADIFISLPKFKTHGLTVLTGAVKNSYGILPGAQKARLHKLAGSPERFHELIVEVFRLRVPDLFIVDAVTGMEGNGPASPELREIGKILASDNAVALDGVIARMMGLEPERIRFLEKAKAEGLGDFDLSSINLHGELSVIPDFKVPALGGSAIAGNPVVQELLTNKMLVRPVADPDLCTSCGVCIDHCPVSALTLDGDLPAVDAETCITCFCCQEMCPEKAMSLK